ncbi:Glu-tRNA(Gln) amidotransferase GatDE subunit E, partial [Candidatus Bathyarchaeota archaeon]|nr:Glu-tRNA(Gln) amidotransferase GatDE subunit E [Candidatus Bathyarchaeota archaeon]
GVKVETLDDETLKQVFTSLDGGLMVKESIPDVLSWLASHPGSTTQDAVKALGLELLQEEELWEIVRGKVRENEELVRRMGLRAVGPLMGAVMREVRGRARAEVVRSLVERALKEFLGE